MVLINCNSTKEAEKIGKALLKERLAACIEITPISKTFYYWPPQKNKIKSGRGARLTAITFQNHINHVEHIAEKLHSDKVPFISATELVHINKSYYNWLSLELK